MSKLGGISLITLGTLGVGLALSRGTKYDPLVKLNVVKPKEKSKLQQGFECEMLFQKITNDYFSIPEYNRQIQEIKKQEEGLQGVKFLTSEEKDRISKLEAKKKEAEKNLSNNMSAYNSSICYKQMPLNGCVTEGNKLDEYYNPDCINSSENGYDCVSLKDDLVNLKEKIDSLSKLPEANRENSSVKGDIDYYTNLLNQKKELYSKGNCKLQPSYRTGVSYKNVRDCIFLDVKNRELMSEIAFRERKKLELGSAWTNSSEINLQKIKSEYANSQNEFITKGCAERLESQKLKDDSILLTEQAIKSEESVLKKNFTEQYVYIGFASVLLLTGFYVVLKK